jgi:uncharacterized repeat protein (TIGR01451 family)
MQEKKAVRRLKKGIVFIAGGLILLWSGLSLAGTVSLPQTGQAVCYDSAGAVIACAGTGQDGEFRAGLPWPSPRFTDNGDRTMTDNLTGLIWAKDAARLNETACYPGQFPDMPLWWEEALDYIECLNTINHLGFNDWRLPNANELESLFLLDAGGTSVREWLMSAGFTRVEDSVYWTSTTAIFDGQASAYAYLAAPGYTLSWGSKEGNGYVWPVRGMPNGPAQVWRTGQASCYDINGNVIACTGTGQDGEFRMGVEWPPTRFTTIYCDNTGPCADQGQDCDTDPSTDAVIDNLTNLMWSRHTSLFSTDILTWQEVLDSAQSLNSGNGLCGFKDWRLPNEKEGHSLQDYSQSLPAIPAGHPFVIVNLYNSYWTSTTYPQTGSRDSAYLFRFYAGGVQAYGKGYGYGYLWPVRTASSGSDLFLKKTANHNPVQVSSPLTYTLTATNYGPAQATGVILTDTLPQGFVFNSYTATQGTCGEAGGVVTCAVGTLNNLASATITLAGTTSAAPGTTANIATVTSTSFDPNLTNNQTSTSIRVSDMLYALTITKGGNGEGTVSGAGFSCGNNCTPAFFEQTKITLTALPAAGSAFYGWLGSGCSGKGNCEVTMNGAKTVQAVFNRSVGPVDLPRTGQTTSYAAGDDGALRKGVNWPDPRFTVVYCDQSGPCTNQGVDCDSNPSTDVIIDQLTGLMWWRDADIFNSAPYGSTWGVGFYFLQNYYNVPNSGYNVCGYYDWRMPNVNELVSLLRMEPTESSISWLEDQGFVKVFDRYWSSTTSDYEKNMAWMFWPAGGIGRDKKYTGGMYRANFWPVRDVPMRPKVQLAKTGQTNCYDNSGNQISCAGTGQDGEYQKGVAWPNPRFTNPDGSAPVSGNVVLDKLTGLMWTKDAYLPGELKYWQGAMDFVAGLNSGSYGGHNDWRLPNVVELHSLMDYSQSTPMLPSDHPFTNVWDGSLYWSSNTNLYSGNPSEAFTLGMTGYMGGFLGVNGKTIDQRGVWAVRGGYKGSANGDFNGDGKPDLVWRNATTGRTTIWYMDGATWNGGYADILPEVVGTEWIIAGIADFNNDSKPDLLWRNTNTGRTTIWYMEGSTWNGGYADVEPTLADPDWSIVGVADFNNDNNPDLLWRNASTGRTTIWYMTGPTWNGGYADVLPTLSDPNWSIVGIADFNGDSNPDLLWRDSVSGRTTIWYMTGPIWNGGYADVMPTLSDPDWQIVAIKDFNVDGSPDLLWRNSSSYRTTVWYMDGPVWNGNWGDLLPIVSDPDWVIVGK